MVIRITWLFNKYLYWGGQEGRQQGKGGGEKGRKVRGKSQPGREPSMEGGSKARMGD